MSTPPSSNPSKPSRPSLDPSLFNTHLYTQLLTSWFSTQPPTLSAPNQDSFQKWFNNPDKQAASRFDSHCTETYGPALHSIGPATYKIQGVESWEEEVALGPHLAAPFLAQIYGEKEGGDARTNGHGGEGGKLRTADTALAMVILLDQIPRNVLRTEQRAIYSHYDVLARAVARSVLSDANEAGRIDLAPGIKGLLSRRMWFYMPFMHSEWVQDHELFERYGREMREDRELNCDEEVGKALGNSENFEERHAVIVRRFGRYPYRNEVMGRDTTEEERRWLEEGGERFTA